MAIEKSLNIRKIAFNIEEIENSLINSSAIHFLVYNYGANGSMYTVDLSESGEPLLQLDFIIELDRYCDEQTNKYNLKANTYQICY